MQVLPKIWPLREDCDIKKRDLSRGRKGDSSIFAQSLEIKEAQATTIPENAIEIVMTIINAITAIPISEFQMTRCKPQYPL